MARILANRIVPPANPLILFPPSGILRAKRILLTKFNLNAYLTGKL